MLLSPDSKPTATLRERARHDIPVLASELFAQQRESGYPFRDPLPVPVEEFLHADDALGAWTAEVAGQPVGHVCWVGPRSGFTDADEMNAACARAHGCRVADLGWVSALFVAASARAMGVGARLLQAAIEDIRAAGRYPCLEVLPIHASAFALYSRSGWQVVTRMRPDWVRAVAGESGLEVHVMVLSVAGHMAEDGAVGDGIADSNP